MRDFNGANDHFKVLTYLVMDFYQSLCYENLIVIVRGGMWHTWTGRQRERRGKREKWRGKNGNRRRDIPFTQKLSDAFRRATYTDISDELSCKGRNHFYKLPRVDQSWIQNSKEK